MRTNSPAAAVPTAYDQIVAPILNARCVSCHGATKQKGKLALHTWDGLAKGGEDGPVFVAGKPADSELLRRLRLAVDEEEHMPPHDEPQPAATEVALLERWITAGASRTATVDSLQLSPELTATIARIPAPRTRTVEAELNPAEVAKLRAPLAATVATLQQKFPGALSYASRSSAALQFTAAGLGRDFGDADLPALAPLRAQLVLLDLAGTAVTDKSARQLATFTQLRVLRVGFTSVGDATLTALAPLKALEKFSLNNTAVTDASLASLRKLSTLRELRLTGTAVTAEAARASGLPVIASLVPEPAEVKVEAK